MTQHEHSALIGWWRQSQDIKLVAALAGISYSHAEIIIDNYLKGKK